MSNTMKILAIPGSLRRALFNRAILTVAAAMAPEGVTVDIFDLHDLPIFNEDLETNPPPVVIELRRRVRDADALLFAVPEYNYSVSAAMKNAIDWGSRPPGSSVWAAKPAAIMGASSGSLGTVRAQAHLRQIFVGLDIRPLNVPEIMIANASTKFGANGTLLDEPTRQLICQLITRLVAAAQLSASGGAQ